MKQHVFRLHPGDDLYDSICAYAKEKAIAAGYIACCVGCVSKATMRDASGARIREIDEPMEIVSITGTVSEQRCHIHIAFSKADLTTVGGHLVSGCTIHTTAEIVICEMVNFVFGKVFDDQTGYHELDIRMIAE